MRFLANRPERSESGFEPDASIRDLAVIVAGMILA